MISTEKRGSIAIISIDRPHARNAVNRETAEALTDALEAFDQDDESTVAILTGSSGNFCAGADLKAIADGEPNRLKPDGRAPMGPSRMRLSKPTIAAIEGYAVAGGLELACFCDMRVAASTATLGVFCRRFGVPLIDGGTVRLPQIIGLGRAMDLILTGRPVQAEEALAIGLVNRVCADGEALDEAVRLANTIAEFPQRCMNADRISAYRGFDLPFDEAMRREFEEGAKVLDEAFEGAGRFNEGEGRSGEF
jgi:enoyl-CoA hydratase